ncbi:unnamed protein product, partial [marine sediment metagenome]
TNIKSPKDFFYLLGLIAGDGYFKLDSRRALIDICFSSDDIDKKICSSLDKCNIKFRYAKERKDKIRHILISDRFFVNDLNKFLWYENGCKLLDLDLIYSDQVILKNIIAGLMDSDGGVDSNKICFYNTSYGLVNFFVMSMKRFGIKTSCRLRNPQSNMIHKGEEDEYLITGRKDIYEILIGSRKGIFFFHEEVSKFMGSLKKIDKMKKKYNISFFGNISKLIVEGREISSYCFTRKKNAFNFLKKASSFCLNTPRTLGEIINYIGKERIPIRKKVFDSYFYQDGTKIILGRKRKLYKFHKSLYGIFENEYEDKDKIMDFIKSKNFKVKPKPLGKSNYISKKTFSPETIRYIAKEKSENIVYDISVTNNENDHYVVNGILAHNCN